MLERLNGWVKILMATVPLATGVVWGYAKLDSDVDTLKIAADTTQTEMKTIAGTVADAKVQQAVTQEQLKQILEAVKEIKDDVKDIKRKERPR